MSYVIIIFKADEICFISEKEEKILAYIESIGFNKVKWEEYMGMTMQEWLDNGHFIGDLSDFLPKDYCIGTFILGLNYQSNSPRFMRAFIKIQEEYSMVYIVTCKNKICFVADNEYDVLKYLAHTPQSGYDLTKFTEEMSISPYLWLDNGHIIDEITEFLEDDFIVAHYCLGYDYRRDSPYYLKEIQ